MGFDELSAEFSSPLTPEITGSPWVFFILLLVPLYGGMGVYLEKNYLHCSN